MRNVKWLLTPLRRRLGVRYPIDYGADYRRTVLLAGTARSGTTWVSEIINHRNEYRYIFEPFNDKKVPLVKPFGARKYMRPAEENHELLEAAQLILSGRIRNRWTERFNRRFIANQRLVKCIRANLLLKWLHVRFPGMPMVLLLRHPCAVAHSYAKQGWPGSVGPLLAQSALVEDFLLPYRPEMERAQTSFERAVFIWCIETLVPLIQFQPGELHVMLYEHLLQEPEVEIGRLFSFLGKEYDASVIAKIVKPSLTSRKDSAISTGANPLDSWRRKIDEEEMRRALEIVRMFGLDGIYSEASLPNASGVARSAESDEANRPYRRGSIVEISPLRKQGGR